MNHGLDATDIKILNLLQQNARIQVKEISEQVYKSATPVHKRICKLQQDGYIQGFVTILNRRKVGWPLLVITQVRLNRHTRAGLRDFATQMGQMSAVQVCLHLSGEYDFLLQVTVRDTPEYEDFLTNHLCALEIVEKVQTFFVLNECKVLTALPL